MAAARVLEGWEEAVVAFRGARKPMALTGAGISVESGIPDFRGAHGLWRTYSPEEYATLDAFRANPAKSWRLFRALGEILIDKHPNAAHEALARLEQRGRLEAVVTQNIDGLHQVAGSGRVLEVHGEHRHLHCIGCGWRRPVDDSDYRQPGVPCCGRCGGPLKPNVVLFGEVVGQLGEARRLIQECDALLVVGTSAEVYPVAEFPFLVQRRGGQVFEFNLEGTALTAAAEFSFPGPCTATLSAFASCVTS